MPAVAGLDRHVPARLDDATDRHAADRIARRPPVRALAGPRASVRARAHSADGALLLKFWLHLARSPSSASASRRPRRIRSTVWRSGKHDRRIYDRYDLARELMERAIRKTSTGHNPWHLVESTDSRYRNLTVGREDPGVAHPATRPARPLERDDDAASGRHHDSVYHRPGDRARQGRSVSHPAAREVLRRARSVEIETVPAGAQGDPNTACRPFWSSRDGMQPARAGSYGG